MNIHLVMALIWLTAGMVVIVSDYTGEGMGWRIRGTDLSFGWLLFVLAVFNLVRWYSGRARRARLLEEQAEEERRQRARRRPRDYQAPDPNFQFTDEPPAGRATDQGPPER